MNNSRGRRIVSNVQRRERGRPDHLKGFTHAWQVNGLKAARPTAITGWARNEALAQQAATSHARSAAKHWRYADRSRRDRTASQVRGISIPTSSSVFPKCNGTVVQAALACDYRYGAPLSPPAPWWTHRPSRRAPVPPAAAPWRSFSFSPAHRSHPTTRLEAH